MLQNTDKRNAQKYLNRFARLIRLILESSRSDSFLLEDEITLLDHYLSLEANRFKGKFRFEIVADDLMNEDFTRIPPMIIQPFVENAIIHGTAQDSDVTIIDKYNDQGESIGTRVEIKLPILAS